MIHSTIELTYFRSHYLIASTLDYRKTKNNVFASNLNKILNKQLNISCDSINLYLAAISITNLKIMQNRNVLLDPLKRHPLDSEKNLIECI